VSPQHVPDRAGKTSDGATPTQVDRSTAHPTGKHRLVRRKPSRRAKLVGLTAALAAAAGSSAVGLHHNAGTATAPTTVAFSTVSTDLGPITTARIERQELTSRSASRLDLSLDSARKLAVSAPGQVDARAAKAAADETLTKRRALALTAAREAAAKAAADKAAAAKVAAAKVAAAKAAAKAAAAKAAADRKEAADQAAAKAAADRRAAAHEAAAKAATAREAAAHRAAVRAAEHQATVKAERREASVMAAPNAQHKASARASARARIVLPVAGYHLTARFNQGGSRWAHRHTGLDFAAPIGTPIRSVMAGVVTQARFAGAYGRQVKVRHSDGTVTSYGHMSRFSVSVGRAVAAGSQVGAVGVTGNTTGPHVHFEVRPGGGAPIDPLPWLRRHGLRP
jgi:murein DD-endopeptidase MepM/ murein hydrolase activator NlpD